MDSDSDAYYEERSENEQEIAAPLNIQVNDNLESPDSPPPGSPPPAPSPPAPIPGGELSTVWEFADGGTNFLIYFNWADVLEL